MSAFLFHRSRHVVIIFRTEADYGRAEIMGMIGRNDASYRFVFIVENTITFVVSLTGHVFYPVSYGVLLIKSSYLFFPSSVNEIRLSDTFVYFAYVKMIRR